MKFLVVVTPPSIYHGCSTWKKFWEEKFTGKKQDLFEPVNMRNCGKRNFRKHREIKQCDERVTYENKYEILELSEKIWHSGYDGNHLIRVKGKNGKIRKGVGNSSDSQDQRKVYKIQNGKV